MENRINSILKENNQEHIIKMLEKMDSEHRKNLENQILEINLKEVNNLYKELKNGYKEEINSIEPLSYVEKCKLTEEEKNDYENIGIEIIKNNKFAVITMAGGQGTRLGHNGPKGTYLLNLEDVFGKKVSIFEVLAQNFLRAKKTYNVDINWYVMTSNSNKEDTIKYFRENNYFDLNKDNIKFFVQNDIPVIDENGKIIIGEDYLIKTASNGNGGIYEVLEEQNILYDMTKKGIEWAFVSGVDNILVNPIDPIFVGLTIKNGDVIAAKTVKKIDPNEKTGVYCKKNGKIGVIEYNEISDDLRNARDLNGDLLYSQSNIISHLYSTKALYLLKDVNLNYHRAHKKMNYINENLEDVIPTEPNAYKFEKFIFDAFENFNNISIMSVKKEEEFAPIKNAVGNDSPETAIELYKRKEWDL